MSFTSKKWFLYLVSSNLFSIPNLHSLRKQNANWHSVNKLSLLLSIISHCSTPKIRELLFSIPNNGAAPVRREGWEIKIPEITLYQWKATFVSSSEPQTCLELSVENLSSPWDSQLPVWALALCELTHPLCPAGLQPRSHLWAPETCRWSSQSSVCQLVSDSEEQAEAAPAPTQTEFIPPHLRRDVVFLLSCF